MFGPANTCDNVFCIFRIYSFSYYIMPYKCPLCEIDPLNHSLVKISESEHLVIFYSCPSKAKLYFDCVGIINHYNGVLSEIPKNKKWVWIFDSDGFNLNHFLQINVGVQIAKLITEKFSDNLLNIIIINPSLYVSLTHKTLKPFLVNKIDNLIKFDYKLTTVRDVIVNYGYEKYNENI